MFMAALQNNRRMIEVSLPLNLTISPAERERSLFIFRNSDGCAAVVSRGFVKRPETILPLPKGDVWGEGKRVSKIS
jgi:hypothetical protein